MSKNYLLSKVFAFALTAIVLNSLFVPAWSVGNVKSEDEDQNSNLAVMVKNSNNAYENENNKGDRDGNINSTQKKNILSFEGLPLELKAHILEMAAFNVGKARKDLSNLALVCKDWNKNIVKNEEHGIKHTIKKAFWRGWYGIIDPQEIAVFEQFYKGTLIYRPTENSDQGMISLPISDLINPLEGAFDLSQCGDTEKYLSINTGYRKERTPANAEKTEVWFTPRFLVYKEAPQLPHNHHMREIIEKWHPEKTSIGIFWTSGNWNAGDEMKHCDYLIAKSLNKLESENLLKIYLNNARTAGMSMGGWIVPTSAVTNADAVSKFHISFVN